VCEYHLVAKENIIAESTEKYSLFFPNTGKFCSARGALSKVFFQSENGVDREKVFSTALD
jgi:hypothetical protein